MTKELFEKIAHAISESSIKWERTQENVGFLDKKSLIESFCQIFSEKNPNFNKIKFHKACK